MLDCYQNVSFPRPPRRSSGVGNTPSDGPALDRRRCDDHRSLHSKHHRRHHAVHLHTLGGRAGSPAHIPDCGLLVPVVSAPHTHCAPGLGQKA